MPPTDARSFLAEAQGEFAMKADRLRRAAAEARSDAAKLDAEAERWEKQAAWAGEAADAIETVQADG